MNHQCVILVAPEDQAVLLPQADEYGPANVRLVLGTWRGGTLVHALVDDEHKAMLEAWAATKPAPVLWWSAADLPIDLKAALRDPESGVAWHDWAGWPNWSAA